MELRKTIKKHFFAPPVHKDFAKGTCMICGTPLEEKDWEKQRTQAHTDILKWVKSHLPPTSGYSPEVKKVLDEYREKILKNLGIFNKENDLPNIKNGTRQIR